MKTSIIKKAKKIILKTIIRMKESSQQFDRTQKQIESARLEIMQEHPELFIRRGVL